MILLVSGYSILYFFSMFMFSFGFSLFKMDKKVINIGTTEKEAKGSRGKLKEIRSYVIKTK